MAETPSSAVSTETTGDVTAAASGAVSTDDGKGKSAADEIRDLRKRAQAAEAQAAELKREKDQREEAERLAKGEHEAVIRELKDKLAALEPEVESYRTAQAARRETLLAQLSDEDKPIADGLPLDKLETLVSRLGKDRVAAPAPAPAARPGHTAQGGMATPEEIQLNIAKPGWLLANKHRIPGASIG